MYCMIIFILRGRYIRIFFNNAIYNLRLFITENLNTAAQNLNCDFEYVIIRI